MNAGDAKQVSKAVTLDLNRIVDDLKEERGRLDRAIAELEGSTPPKIVVKKASVARRQPVASKGKKRAGITPEGRKRLSLAMKRHWAERRKNRS